MAKVNSGTMTVTVFAALVGLGGAFVVRQTMQRPPAETPTERAAAAPAPVIVPLAALDLVIGRKVTLNDIAPQRMSQEEFKKSEFRKVTFMGNTLQIQGRTLRKAIPAGRPFQPDDFFPDGAGPDIADRLQPGYRAVTVPIENVGHVNGFAVPGSIVDLLFRAKPEGVRPAVTLTLLEKIEVLAFNVNTTQGMRDPGTSPTSMATVTLAVTPQQAKILKVVEGRGDISLTLRNPKDDFQFAPVEVGMRPDLYKKTHDLNPEPDEEFKAITTRKAQEATKPQAMAAEKKSNDASARASGAKFPPKLMVDDNADDDQIAASLLGAITMADRELAAEGNVDRVIGNATERLTLDDLLGIKPAPRKRSLEIYLGSQRTVVNFDEGSQDNSDPRIQTPIVGTPASRPNPLANATTAQK